MNHRVPIYNFHSLSSSRFGSCQARSLKCRHEHSYVWYGVSLWNRRTCTRMWIDPKESIWQRLGSLRALPERSILGISLAFCKQNAFPFLMMVRASGGRCWWRSQIAIRNGVDDFIYMLLLWVFSSVVCWLRCRGRTLEILLKSKHPPQFRFCVFLCLRTLNFGFTGVHKKQQYYWSWTAGSSRKTKQCWSSHVKIV